MQSHPRKTPSWSVAVGKNIPFFCLTEILLDAFYCNIKQLLVLVIMLIHQVIMIFFFFTDRYTFIERKEKERNLLRETYLDKQFDLDQTTSGIAQQKFRTGK